MNWKRGLFRLWIVSSLVWLGLVGVRYYDPFFTHGYNSFTQNYRVSESAPFAVLFYPEFANFEVDGLGAAVREEEQRRNVRGVLHYQELTPPGLVDAARTAMAERLSQLQEFPDRERVALILPVMALMFVPPLLALLVWAVMAWVGRGFSRKVA